MSQAQADLLARAEESTRQLTQGQEYLGMLARNARSCREIIEFQEGRERKNLTLFSGANDLLIATRQEQQRIETWLKEHMIRHEKLMAEVTEGRD